jgi:hypothetical protein
MHFRGDYFKISTIKFLPELEEQEITLLSANPSQL